MTPVDAVSGGARTLGVGLFALDPLTLTQTEAAFSIALDPAEPYLDDHRPGGDPLFSTVMAIEAAVSGARILQAGTAQAWVTQIDVHKPFILAERRQHVIELHVVRRPDGDDGFYCTLSSVNDGGRVNHLHAVVRFDVPTSGAHDALPAPFSFPVPGPVVQAARVYELFFHGPSFRVIGEAQYRAGTMLTRLKQHLPPYLRRTGTVSQMAPRLIEFALQSAGLLEVAANGRMKIPHFIGSIERRLPMDADTPVTLFARATYGSADEGHINIDVVDASGRLILRVADYRTVVLPFNHSGDAIAGLRAQFLG